MNSIFHSFCTGAALWAPRLTSSNHPWTPLQACSSPAQLLSLHTVLRRPRAAALRLEPAVSQSQGGAGAAALSGVLAWMPLDFKLLPLGLGREEEAIEVGVWVRKRAG